MKQLIRDEWHGEDAQLRRKRSEERRMRERRKERRGREEEEMRHGKSVDGKVERWEKESTGEKQMIDE